MTTASSVKTTIETAVESAIDFKDDRPLDRALLVQGYEVVIGFETHSQLSTLSKIFSRASTAFGAEPNTQACAVDLALPGTLPVMNKGAVERAIQFGLAIGARIAPRSIFARKNYFYPDLPKGYQISQFEIPVVQGGSVEFFLDAPGSSSASSERVKKSVRLVRAHLEEDAGKSLHEDFVGQSGIDLNRAGTPLLEIVTEPDMRSSAEAVAYAKELHKIVTWIGICDGNMQEGSFRCDANVSVRKPGAKFGTRREIKNLNSFEFMQQAIDYEVRWQIEQIEDGHTIEQATVLFNPDTGETRAMRTKEDAADYRYFPDPDLPPLCIDAAWIERLRAEQIEKQDVMAARFVTNFGLSEYDAAAMTQTRPMAAYFEATVKATEEKKLAKLACNWIMGEISRRLNLDNLDISACPVEPSKLAWLISLIHSGTILNNGGKTLLQSLWDKQTPGVIDGEFAPLTGDLTSGTASSSLDSLIDELGLRQSNDTGELEAIIDTVLASNAKSVEEYKAGNAKAFNALVGQAMKATKGKGNPAQVNGLLKKKLG
jgi:aspartyl-tRNA(Asn)/glutamyl-tRNA(Gln) amidotransferase subunit B